MTTLCEYMKILPREITTHIYEYIPPLNRTMLNKTLYEENRLAYANTYPFLTMKVIFVKRFGTIVTMFGHLLCENFSKWQHMNNYRYKNFTFDDYISYITYLSQEHDASKVHALIIAKQNKDGRKRHKNMRVRSNNMEQLIFNQLLDRETIAQEIKDVLKDFEQTKGDLFKKRGLYIYGAPGCGKTTFVMRLLKEAGYDVVMYDAGDIRNKTIIDTIAKNNMAEKNIVSLFHKKAQPIAIVMDEIDGMNNGDKGGINALIRLIRPKKTKKQRLEDTTRSPVICISNYHVDKKIKELMKVCHTFELKTPTTSQISQILAKQCQSLTQP